MLAGRVSGDPSIFPVLWVPLQRGFSTPHKTKQKQESKVREINHSIVANKHAYPLSITSLSQKCMHFIFNVFYFTILLYHEV